jgi:hypothetical protein
MRVRLINSTNYSTPLSHINMAKNASPDKSGFSAPDLGTTIPPNSNVSDPFVDVVTSPSHTSESSSEEYVLPTVSQDGWVGNQLEYYERFGYPSTPEYIRDKIKNLQHKLGLPSSSPCPANKGNNQEVRNPCSYIHKKGFSYNSRQSRVPMDTRKRGRPSYDADVSSPGKENAMRSRPAKRQKKSKQDSNDICEEILRLLQQHLEETRGLRRKMASLVTEMHSR